jgi:hypothetical protein
MEGYLVWEKPSKANTAGLRYPAIDKGKLYVYLSAASIAPDQAAYH